MANGPLPCVSYEVLKCLKFPPLNFVPWTCADNSEHAHCADEFLATVAEGVVHSVYKVVTRSSFSVIRQHKASGGIWSFRHYDTRSHTNLKQ